MRTLLGILWSGVLASALVLGAHGRPALADDEPVPDDPPKPTSGEDPLVAPYISETLIPGSDATPAGWKLLDDDEAAAEGPREAQLAALAEELGIGAEKFYPMLQSYGRDGATVTMAMIDVDANVRAFRDALGAKAAESGWRVSELGHPGRLLVLGGPADATQALEKQLVEHVVYKLSDLAMNRLRGDAGTEEAGREAALTYAESIRMLAKGSGTADSLEGVVHWIRSQPKPPVTKDSKHDKAEQEKAVAAFTRALQPGVAFPPKGSVRVFVAAELGSLLLLLGDRSRLPQAVAALEQAVELEADGRTVAGRQGNRYNLACAYALAGRLDQAFAMLEKSLEILKNMPAEHWRTQHKYIDEKDDDMKPLRGDPRFSELMKRFEPPAPKKPKIPERKPDGADPHDPHK